MRNVNNIAIHCSAGFGDVESIKKFWKEKLGWNSPGYHRIIDLEGKVHELLDFSQISNGVKGYNSSLINICYIGGVENVGTKEKPKWKGKDTRTYEQKNGLHKSIQEAIQWLKDNGKDITKDLGVVGHLDFSKDNNSNGVIESWERIKECPSFDAIKEYSELYASSDRYNKLPYN